MWSWSIRLVLHSDRAHRHRFRVSIHYGFECSLFEPDPVAKHERHAGHHGMELVAVATEEAVVIFEGVKPDDVAAGKITPTDCSLIWQPQGL
jgi:hypothetical protein